MAAMSHNSNSSSKFHAVTLSHKPMCLYLITIYINLYTVTKNVLILSLIFFNIAVTGESY